MSEKTSDSIGFAAARHSQRVSPSSVICAIVLDPGYGGPRMRKSDRSGRSGDSQFKAYGAGMLPLTQPSSLHARLLPDQSW